MDINDLVAANAPMAGTGANGPTIAIGPEPAVKPPIKVTADLPVASVPSAKAAYRKTGAYTEAEIDAAFAAHVPDKTQGPVHNERDGVALSKDAQAAAYQKLFDEGTIDRATIVAEAARAGIQIRGADGQFIAAPGANYQAPDISLNYAGLPGIAETPPEDFAAFNAQAVTAFGALGVSQSTAQQAIESFVCTADAMPDGPVDEDAMRAKWEIEGGIINGLSDAANIKRLATIGEEALKKVAPDFYATLNEAFAFHSASAQLALAQIGRAVERGGN